MPCHCGRGVSRSPKGGEVVDSIRSLPMRAYVALAGLGESVNELKKREEGQALVEYALLLALIAIVSIAVLTVLGTKVSHIFSKISTKL
jgi:pilus assembly protein Flp/PilA